MKKLISQKGINDLVVRLNMAESRISELLKVCEKYDESRSREIKLRKALLNALDGKGIPECKKVLEWHKSVVL